MTMRHPFVRWMLAVTGFTLFLSGTASAGAAPADGPPAPQDEVFYQIFVRSFHDSNGDSVGDLKGIEEKLGYLQDLGVTTVLLTPLYQSPVYHSYFARDFAKIDPAYGDEAALRSLAKALHRRRMQLFLDQEIHYVTSDHVWFKDSLEKPKSKYSGYVLYNGPGNTQPESGYLGISELPTYQGTKVRIATVNLYNPAVLKYQTRLFEHWMADGVDGFRIDHMMDNLDFKGKVTDLFQRFWVPMFKQLRAVNPKVRILAEQADWGYGQDWLEKGQVDMVFAFPTRKAIVSLDKKQITDAVTETWQKTPPGKQQVTFIENHDVNRFASEAGGDLGKEKLGAALDLLLKGIPLIYYGQELGMLGKQVEAWKSDGVDIPVREAFRWQAAVAGPGMALWYKDTGPWWTQSSLKDHDGISVAEQAGRPESLLSWYKSLLALRRVHPELVAGDQVIVDNDSDHVFSFERTSGSHRLLVVANLGAATDLHLAASAVAPQPQAPSLTDLMAGGSITATDGKFAIKLPDYGVRMFEVSAGS